MECGLKYTIISSIQVKRAGSTLLLVGSCNEHQAYSDMTKHEIIEISYTNSIRDENNPT